MAQRVNTVYEAIRIHLDTGEAAIVRSIKDLLEAEAWCKRMNIVFEKKEIDWFMLLRYPDGKVGVFY